MPSEYQSGSSAPDRPTYPELEERVGEDPARFLATEIEPDSGDGTSGQLALARISGLETVELCNAYLEVETDRDEPRGQVIAAINQQKRELTDEAADAGESTQPEEASV